MLPRLLVLLWIAAAPARAEANAVRRALEARYRGAKTLEAVFFEKYSDGSGGIVAESGTVYFSRDPYGDCAAHAGWFECRLEETARTLRTANFPAITPAPGEF